MKVKFHTTEAQTKLFEGQCDLMESLYATGLMQHFNIELTDENFTMVKGWLKCARDSGVANFVFSGMKAEINTDWVDADSPEGKEKLAKFFRYSGDTGTEKTESRKELDLLKTLRVGGEKRVKYIGDLKIPQN